MLVAAPVGEAVVLDTVFCVTILTPRPPNSTLFPYTTLFRSYPVIARSACGSCGKCIGDERDVKATSVCATRRDREGAVEARSHRSLTVAPRRDIALSMSFKQCTLEAH